MIDEPRVAFVYRSLIILGLSDFGLFHGVLLVGPQDLQFGPILARLLDYYSILGSLSDFHD